MKGGASDALYNGDHFTIEEVLELYQAQIIQEMYPHKGDTSDPQMEQFDALIEQNEEAVKIARSLYEEYGDDASAFMYAHENELVSDIGKAIITGDYACLAI